MSDHVESEAELDAEVSAELELSRSARKKLRKELAARSRSATPSSDIGSARSSRVATPIPTSMPAGRVLPLLICSIGNPGATYANTLHSAGHTVINHLAEHLGFASFQKERDFGNGLVSKGSDPDWTLWQSTSYMNESGRGVRAAHTAWSRNIPDGEGKLVILHDELEKPLGAVSVKTVQGASAKGHNGLKSILAVIGKTPFVRIGIGIGRPVSREPDDVARYVLKKMTPAEKAKIEGCVDEVIAKLKQVAAG